RARLVRPDGSAPAARRAKAPDEVPVPRLDRPAARGRAGTRRVLRQLSLSLLLLFFFVAFNLLEACLPSLVSRVAPAASGGTALGGHNTAQALGLVAGGAAGGWLAQHGGEASVFVFGFAVVALWLLVASSMRVPVGAEGVS